jgi:hypothetical protein
MTLYYVGVYVDCEEKVLQVADDIDYLSCEILAKPGVLSIRGNVKEMLTQAGALAKEYQCKHLEVSCSGGKGSHKWLKIYQ